MSDLAKVWEDSNRTPVLLITGVMIFIIAVADWWTRPLVSLGFLYFIPIMLAAGFLPRPVLLGLAVLCAALSEIFNPLEPDGKVIRLTLESFALAGCGLFISELLRNRGLAVETQTLLRTLVETSPAAIIVVDQRGVIESANDAAVELMVPSKADLVGQPIAMFVPALQNAFPPGGETEFRASMQCQVRRGNRRSCVANVWFSTFKENGVPKLAAIIASVTEEQPAVADSAIGAFVDIPLRLAKYDDRHRPRLNGRQLAVLKLVFEGLTNNQIASRLNMKVSTVRNIVQQLFLKTGTSSRSQVVRVAFERYRDLL